MNNLVEAIDVDRGEYVAHGNFTAAEAFPHPMQQQDLPKENYSIHWRQPREGQQLVVKPSMSMQQLNHGLLEGDRSTIPVIQRSVQIRARDVPVDQWSAALIAFEYMDVLKSQGRRRAMDADRAYMRFKCTDTDQCGNAGDKWITTQTVPVFEVTDAVENAITAAMQKRRDI